jgi:hypothetical protein
MWDKLDRGHKLIAAILGLGGLGGGIVTGITFIAHYAAASEVKPVETRVTKLEDAHQGEIEWRRYLILRLDHISGAVGAPTVAPPESAVSEPKESR